MADYTEEWKQWAREAEYSRCTCPVCRQYKEDDYCSESCCLECAEDYMEILEDVASIVPINVRGRIIEEITKDDNDKLWEWGLNNTELSKEEVIELLNGIKNIKSAHVLLYWKRYWEEKKNGKK